MFRRFNISDHYDADNGTYYRTRISIVALFLLTSLSVMIYAGVMQNDFVDYDDKRIILDNIYRYDGLNIENITRIFKQDFPREEPLLLRDLSYLVNAEIFGEMNPRGYLIGNILLHIMVSFLVYHLTLLLFPKNHLAAIFSSVLFAIHPLHVESIAWISSRKDPLYVVFYIGALLQFGDFLIRGRKKALLGSYLLFVFALFSKAAAISFLPMLLCFRFCFKKARKFTGIECSYFLLLLLTLILFVKWYTGVLSEYGVIEDNLNKRDWVLWFFSSCEYLRFYVHKLIFPFNLSIVYDYPSPNLIYQNRLSLFIAVLLITFICAILYWCYYKRYNVYVFLILFFISGFIPYFDLARVNIYVADRYAYLSSVPFCILAVILAIKCYKYLNISTKKLSWIVVFCCACISVFFVLHTKNMTAVWKDTFSLWSNAAQNSKYRPDVYTGLLRAYMNMYINGIGNPNAQKILIDAQALGEHGIEIFCDSELRCPEQVDQIATYLAEIYWQQGKYDKANEWFNRAMNINPQYPESRFMYISFLIETGEYQKAIGHLRLLGEIADPHKDQKMLINMNTVMWPILNNKMRNTEE